MTLHLLRPLVPELWGHKAGMETVGEICDYIRDRAEQRGMLGTWTSRWPRRAEELHGGSVYFAHKKQTVFRLAIRRVVRNHSRMIRPAGPPLHRIELGAVPVLVESRHVGMVRGWRYLEGDAVPPDLGATDNLENAETIAELERLGLA